MLLQHHPQSRHFWGFGKKGKEERGTQALTLPNIADLLRRKPKAPEPVSEKPQVEYKRASLAKTSIFEEESQPEEENERKEKGEIARERKLEPIPDIPGLNIDRDSVTRKMRLRLAKRRGVLTRKEKIAQAEKRHQSKSHFIKTSIKKLGPLARQISGKPIGDAKVQMCFSKKKAAKEVLEHLKQAEAEAIVTRNFDGKKMYISEAWVGRGTPDKELERRARGRINVLHKPYTSITVVLKEEKTRDRIAKEKEAKRWRKKPWVQLPNRPIQGQHQYYTW